MYNQEPIAWLALVKRGVVISVAVIFVIALVIAGSVGGCGLVKNWKRGQAQADARNRVAITHIEIQNQDQQAKVVKAQNAIVQAKAYQRYLEAVGIRRSQDEIAATLTPLYVQHEAIQAQEQIASSGQNNTVIYVPSGGNGVPMVLPAAQGHIK